MPATVQIAERFIFYQVKQKPEESVANFFATLRNLAKDCAFGIFLDQLYETVFYRPPSPMHPNQIISRSDVNVRLSVQVSKQHGSC